ncbi:MAG: hypothetical protein CMC10_05040 [Flavobacteriaceae bacterium]|nr:hypothetical protein [Flavobacteriaceae bacterium]
MNHFFTYLPTNILIAAKIILTIYIEMNETIQPIIYNCTEKTFSILFKDLSVEVNSSNSRKINPNINDITKLNIIQNNSLRMIDFIFSIYGF